MIGRVRERRIRAEWNGKQEKSLRKIIGDR
jgi:hypothetical protein